MSSDTALAPNKKAREICWSYRDKLFDCLDKYNDDLSKCTEEIQGVENNCKKMWVSYIMIDKPRGIYFKYIHP